MFPYYVNSAVWALVQMRCEVRSAESGVRSAESGVRRQNSGGLCVEEAASPLHPDCPLLPKQVEMSNHVEKGKERLGIR